MADATSARIARETGATPADRRRLATDLANRLAAQVGAQVHLVVTNNTSTMVSYRWQESLLRMRVHHMFVGAPKEVVGALAGYAKGCAVSGRAINDFVQRNVAQVRETRRRRHEGNLQAQGSHHDLGAYFDDLNRRFFGSRIEAKIGWGRGAPGRKRRSIRMGVYLHESRVIRIHPALDRPEVPAYFVRFVVFHEMLHQAIPPRLVGGRRIAHSAEFRRAEQAYPDYERAMRWERENIQLLLAAPRRAPAFDLDDPLA